MGSSICFAEPPSLRSVTDVPLSAGQHRTWRPSFWTLQLRPRLRQPRQRLSSQTLPSSSPAPTDMAQANPAPTAESLFAILWEIQLSMATLRRPRSPSPHSQGKWARLEEVPMEHMAGPSTHDTPGPLSPSPPAAPSIGLPPIIPASSSPGPRPTGWYPIPATWRIIYNEDSVPRNSDLR